MALVCETVMATRMADLIAARDAARLADIVELRLDGVRDPDVAGALERRTRPVIVTCRPVWEGGRFEGSEEDRLRLLADALEHGAEFIDVEWMADRRLLPRGTEGRWVLSSHDFNGVPSDLARRARAMHEGHPGVVKIAVTAARAVDCVTLRRALPDTGERVAIAMGPAGILTRVCPWLFGSSWTYGGQAAPGQIGVREMVEELRVREGTDRTAVFAALCRGGVEPVWVRAARARLAHAGLDARIVPIEVDDIEEFFTLADEFGLAGADVPAHVGGDWAARAKLLGDGPVAPGGDVLLRRAEPGWEAACSPPPRIGSTSAGTTHVEVERDRVAFWTARVIPENRS